MSPFFRFEVAIKEAQSPNAKTEMLEEAKAMIRQSYRYKYYKQGMGCDHFLGRTHAPRTSRFRSARTRVRTSNLEWSHFTPAPAPFVN